MQDFKFFDNFRGSNNFQYCEWTNKNLKNCTKENRYDKNLNNITALMFFVYNFKHFVCISNHC